MSGPYPGRRYSPTEESSWVDAPRLSPRSALRSLQGEQLPASSTSPARSYAALNSDRAPDTRSYNPWPKDNATSSHRLTPGRLPFASRRSISQSNTGGPSSSSSSVTSPSRLGSGHSHRSALYSDSDTVIFSSSPSESGPRLPVILDSRTRHSSIPGVKHGGQVRHGSGDGDPEPFMPTLPMKPKLPRSHSSSFFTAERRSRLSISDIANPSALSPQESSSQHRSMQTLPSIQASSLPFRSSLAQTHRDSESRAYPLRNTRTAHRPSTIDHEGFKVPSMREEEEEPFAYSLDRQEPGSRSSSVSGAESLSTSYFGSSEYGHRSSVQSGGSSGWSWQSNRSGNIFLPGPIAPLPNRRISAIADDSVVSPLDSSRSFEDAFARGSISASGRHRGDSDANQYPSAPGLYDSYYSQYAPPMGDSAASATGTSSRLFLPRTSLPASHPSLSGKDNLYESIPPSGIKANDKDSRTLFGGATGSAPQRRPSPRSRFSSSVLPHRQGEVNGEESSRASLGSYVGGILASPASRSDRAHYRHPPREFDETEDGYESPGIQHSRDRLSPSLSSTSTKRRRSAVVAKSHAEASADPPSFTYSMVAPQRISEHRDSGYRYPSESSRAPHQADLSHDISRAIDAATDTPLGHSLSSTRRAHTYDERLMHSAPGQRSSPTPQRPRDFQRTESHESSPFAGGKSASASKLLHSASSPSHSAGAASGRQPVTTGSSSPSSLLPTKKVSHEEVMSRLNRKMKERIRLKKLFQESRGGENTASSGENAHPSVLTSSCASSVSPSSSPSSASTSRPRTSSTAGASTGSFSRGTTSTPVIGIASLLGSTALHSDNDDEDENDEDVSNAYEDDDDDEVDDVDELVDDGM